MTTNFSCLSFNKRKRLVSLETNLFYVRPAWAQSQGLKSLVCPSSGKDIAKGKGVVREGESEGSWMANLWSDEQKSH
jgi:hypothetical protein